MLLFLWLGGDTSTSGKRSLRTWNCIMPVFMCSMIGIDGTFAFSIVYNSYANFVQKLLKCCCGVIDVLQVINSCFKLEIEFLNFMSVPLRYV